MTASDGHRFRWSAARVPRAEWLGLAAGLFAVGSLLLPWTRLHTAAPAVAAALAELPVEDVSRSVWRSTFFGWFAPLLVAVVGVLVAAFGRYRRVRVAGLPQLWLVASVVAGCSAALAWVFMDWQFGPDERVFLVESGVSLHAGAGRYLALAAVLLSLLGAVLDVRAGTGPARSSGRTRRMGRD